jgi:hypothetical protein
LLQPDQPRIVLRRHVGEFGRGMGRGGAVHQQDREAVAPDRLLAQPVQAVAHIERPIMGADANGEVHAGKRRGKD